MKNIATGDVLERIRRLAPSHVTAPFKTVAEWREWQLSEGQKRCEEINRQNRQLRVEKILNRSGIQPLHRKCSFSNYQVQNEAQRYALSQAKSIADELMTGCTNFAFSGKPGTGKNHLAAAIGKVRSLILSKFIAQVFRLLLMVEVSCQCRTNIFTKMRPVGDSPAGSDC